MMQGRCHDFFFFGGGGGFIGHLLPKFSFSSDVSHFIWKMLENAKKTRFKKKDSGGVAPAAFESAGS